MGGRAQSPPLTDKQQLHKAIVAAYGMRRQARAHPARACAACSTGAQSSNAMRCNATHRNAKLRVTPHTHHHHPNPTALLYVLVPAGVSHGRNTPAGRGEAVRGVGPAEGSVGV